MEESTTTIVLTLTPDFKKGSVQRFVIKVRRSFKELSWVLVGETSDHGEEHYSLNDSGRGHGAVASSSLFRLFRQTLVPRTGRYRSLD